MGKKYPRYTIVPCQNVKLGTRILCNGFPYLRTDMANIPAEEHDAMALEIVELLKKAEVKE